MNSPPRFVISDDTPGFKDGANFRVTGSELHHMRDVMRLRVGAEVVLCASNGVEYVGCIAGFEPRAALIKVVIAPHDQDPASPRLILAAGMIKAARMDLLIEKAAELNAAEFWPLACARSLVRGTSSGRRERWRRISLAAAKQSQRSHVMEVHEPIDVDEMVRGVPKAAVAVTCIAGAKPFSAILRGMPGISACPTVLLAVGPEGDFTAEELTAMHQAGFIAAGLGRNRLRSETAALAALSVANIFFAELDSNAELQRRGATAARVTSE